MVKLNTCFFIDIENCLISTRSGKDKPIALADWSFNDVVLEYINSQDFDFICLVSDRPISDIANKRRYEQLIDFIQEQLAKGFKIPVKTIYYNVADGYFNYPCPGGIFSFAIENDVNLANSVYVSEDTRAAHLSSVGIRFSLSNLILNG
tara:strand:+ start:61973 stop:62419 length:447 start_codon:yes stop_codon:yes gene_type:complete